MGEKALAIGIGAVSNGNDVYYSLAVIYGINHSIITDADAPK